VVMDVARVVREEEVVNEQGEIAVTDLQLELTSGEEGGG
jgi:hypothetical protein